MAWIEIYHRHAFILQRIESGGKTSKKQYVLQQEKIRNIIMKNAFTLLTLLFL